MATKLLSGFNGSAIISFIGGSYQLLATNGSVSADSNQTFVTLMDINPDVTQRTKVLYAPGTYITNGSLSWDVHRDTMDLFWPSRLLSRRFQFDVSMWGGNLAQDYAGKQVIGCYATSISMQGAQGGLLTVSLSFISPNTWEDWNNGGSYISTRSNNASNTPYGYWYSGNPNIPVKDWSLSISQDVIPVYLNQYAQQWDGSYRYPKYMKCGLWNTDLSVTTFRQLNGSEETNEFGNMANLVVATKAFSIQGALKTKSYTFNGSSDTSTYSYTFGSASLNLLPNVNTVL